MKAKADKKRAAPYSSLGRMSTTGSTTNSAEHAVEQLERSVTNAATGGENMWQKLRSAEQPAPVLNSLGVPNAPVLNSLEVQSTALEVPNPTPSTCPHVAAVLDSIPKETLDWQTQPEPVPRWVDHGACRQRSRSQQRRPRSSFDFTRPRLWGGVPSATTQHGAASSDVLASSSSLVSKLLANRAPMPPMPPPYSPSPPQLARHTARASGLYFVT